MHRSWALEPFVEGGVACSISTTSRSHMQIADLEFWKEEKGLLHDEGLDCTLIERLVRGVVQRKGLTP